MSHCNNFAPVNVQLVNSTICQRNPYPVGVSNGRGETLRDSETRHIFASPRRFFTNFLCFQNSRLWNSFFGEKTRSFFGEKTRIWDPQNLINNFVRLTFCRGHSTPLPLDKLMMLSKKCICWIRTCPTASALHSLMNNWDLRAFQYQCLNLLDLVVTQSHTEQRGSISGALWAVCITM